MLELFVFEAELTDDQGLSRRLMLPAGDTLRSLHELLRLAFQWGKDGPYAFRLVRELDADTRLDRLGLEAGAELAYAFSGTGEERRVRLELVERATGREAVPLVLVRRGEPEPEPDEIELGCGD